MTSSSPNRRLAAILMADVVGYSRLMHEDEAGTLAALKERRAAVVAPLVRQHAGRVVKFLGDGVLIEFASAVNAVAFALDLQRRMSEMNEPVAESRRIRLRIGINLGDVIAEGSDIYGDGVNIAARLESLAEPGGMCVSEAVHEQVRGKLPFAATDMGEQHLKNIDRPVRAWRVEAAEQELAGPVSLALPDRPSVAVLPFQNMSGDASQSYFSDGITEDIITELSKFRSLFVIARNSTFQYRDKAVDVRKVARELGVQFIVEGSIRKSGSRLRVTAQLIDALSGNHIWADRYDRSLEDVFAVESEITQTIVSTLAGRVEDAEFDRAIHRPTSNMAAYDCLLRAIVQIRGFGKEGNRLARDFCEQAVSLDPTFALAHAYLGLALVVEHGYAGAPAPIKQRALECAREAVRLAPSDARCHWLLGNIYFFRSEFDFALYHHERSSEINPNDASVMATHGAILGFCGRAEEGIALVRLAMRLNPFHPEWYWVDLAIALYAAHRYEEALSINLRLSEKKVLPDLVRLAACLGQLGRLDEAKRCAREILQIKPDFRISGYDIVVVNSAISEHFAEGMRKAGLPE